MLNYQRVIVMAVMAPNPSIPGPESASWLLPLKHLAVTGHFG